MLRKLAQLAGPLAAVSVRLSGPARFGGGELSAAYVGNGTNLSYLGGLFFEHVTAETLASGLHPVQVRSTLTRLASSGLDLVLSELPALWAPLLPRTGTIRFPAWVRQEIDLPRHRSPADVWLLPRAVERECDRLIRRHRYVMDLTSDSEAMQLFFRNFYRPYVRSRFGAGSFVDDEGGFMKRSRGYRLARLHADGQWAAGLLVKRRGGSLRLGRFGAASDPAPPGSSEVLDTLVIRRAYSEGVRHIVMGDTRPCLADGVLRYKARFGAQIRPTLFPQPTLSVHVTRWSETVAVCIKNQPLVALRSDEAHVWQLGAIEGAPFVELKLLARDRR